MVSDCFDNGVVSTEDEAEEEEEEAELCTYIYIIEAQSSRRWRYPFIR